MLGGKGVSSVMFEKFMLNNRWCYFGVNMMSVNAIDQNVPQTNICSMYLLTKYCCDIEKTNKGSMQHLSIIMSLTRQMMVLLHPGTNGL